MRFKNILLVKPSGRSGLSFLVDQIPLGLEYIAAYIEDLVDEVHIVDMEMEKRSFQNLIDLCHPDMVGITMSATEHNEGLRLAKIAKKNRITTFVGGYHPTLDPDMIKEMCQWIVKELGPDVPIHFTRFYSQYRMKNLPPTPVSTLEYAREIALEAGINFCYVGNVPGHAGENTYCPQCNKVIIKRRGYFILKNNLEKGKCKECKYHIPGVWS